MTYSPTQYRFLWGEWFSLCSSGRLPQAYTDLLGEGKLFFDIFTLIAFEGFLQTNLEGTKLIQWSMKDSCWIVSSAGQLFSRKLNIYATD